ncbi:unnamed protein product [Cuscuta campestris]|uniref:RING-type domain-containing protein n=1 Tax=Cuscuta campestris TaxID=132261 RepID=A0A484LGY6_9ASTE|nr:unnamed protein product [Cuscuta campestris]
MYTDQKKCQPLAASSSFYRKIYSEVEEIGWGNLVRLGEDLTSLSFRIIDRKGRTHMVGIKLDKAYPKSPPSVSVDVPSIFNLQWSPHSKLSGVLDQFGQHLDKLQPFWSTMDEIDSSLRVCAPKQTRFASSQRQIDIGNGCYIVLCIDPDDPKALPECRFIGPHSEVNVLVTTWRRNCWRWIRDKSFVENVKSLLKIHLPEHPNEPKSDQLCEECGICYAQNLPIDTELGVDSGCGTDITCKNNNCRKAFHRICLLDWLRSITTTRQSFDVLYGNCPYCSDPVSVKTL